MVYVALLRGINVGGNSRVEMARLKTVFESLGFSNVTTYINSGNVIFSDHDLSTNKLADKIENAIEIEFSLKVPVVVRDLSNIQAVNKALPTSWTNDTTMKTDVMFLWDGYDSPEILKSLTIKPAIDDVKYVPGAILWRVDRKNVTKSGMLKIVGSELYKNMTVRNCNTLRRLAVMMSDIE
jgi:uncharacterized protein (DUF1697 family)